MAFPANTGNKSRQGLPYTLFRLSPLMQLFRNQLRLFFEQRVAFLSGLMELKQKEILLLLVAAGYKNAVEQFIAAAISNHSGDMEYFVNSYLFQPLRLTDLASLCNRSLAAFKRDFQRIYGAPPRQWINQQRLAQAQMLLLTTNHTIAAIANECGYDNPSHFIQLYKNAFGETPGAKRAKIRIS